MFVCVFYVVPAGFIQCAMVWANIDILRALDIKYMSHVTHVCTVALSCLRSLFVRMRECLSPYPSSAVGSWEGTR